MNYIFSLTHHDYFLKNLESITKVLPSNIKLFEEDGKCKVNISVVDNASEDSAKYLVSRELNRIFFFTGIQSSPTFEYVVNTDGKCVQRSEFSFSYRIENSLPEKLSVQEWKEPLSIQLELWRIANLGGTPLLSKINIFFQIIESTYSSHSDFEEYKDSNIAPAPKTECRLLRHLVSHQGNDRKSQLTKYCKYLGLSETSFDPGQDEVQRLLRSKINLLEEEARKTINESFECNSL